MSIFDEKAAYIINMVNEFDRAYDQTTPFILDYIDERLDQFAQRSGNFVSQTPDQWAATRTQVRNLINEAFVQAGYVDNVSQYLADFNQIDRYNERLQLRYNDLEVNLRTPKLRTARLAIADDVVQGLWGETFNANIAQPLQNALTNAITNGGSRSDVLQALKNELEGTTQVESLRGRVKFYAENAVRQYDGAVNDVLRNELGLNTALYIGSLIETSRPQCRWWVRQREIPYDDLKDQIARAVANGSGMIPGTTPESFARDRGGYNCRHQVIYIRQ